MLGLTFYLQTRNYNLKHDKYLSRKKSSKVRNKLIEVIENSGITKSVKILKRSTKIKDMNAIRKKKSNMIERSKSSVG